MRLGNNWNPHTLLVGVNCSEVGKPEVSDKTNTCIFYHPAVSTEFGICWVKSNAFAANYM